ncbi:hypothetical protein AgCh_000886 [Apium graveolens]
MSLKPVDSTFTDVRILISYNDKIGWETDLPPFDVSPKNPPMQFGKEFLAWSDKIDDSTISDIRQHINGGKVKFNLGFKAWVKPIYVNGWMRTSWVCSYRWTMICENVELVFGTSDISKPQMSNASHTCKFDKVYLRSDSGGCV